MSLWIENNMQKFVLLEQFFINFKVNPKRSITVLLAGKKRYNFITMITFEKKKSFLLQKIFQLTNYIQYIYQINIIKCIFKKIKLCWQAKMVNFFLYTKQTLFNSSLYSFPLMAYDNNILTSQNTLKPNLLKWPSIHCTIVLMTSIVSKLIRQ